MDDIFVIKVKDKFLLYSPLQNITALMNHSAIKKIAVSCHNSIKEIIQDSYNSKYKEEKIDKIIQLLKANNSNLPTRLKNTLDPVFLGILPTRNCNAVCAYCNFDSDLTKTHFLEIKSALLIIDWMFEQFKQIKRDTFELHFFGGEPTIHTDMIEVIIYRVRYLAQQYNLKTHFEISTNGAFDKKFAGFIGDYFNSVVLSLDGTKEIQNKQRRLKGSNDSFEVVLGNAKILSDSQTELCIRVCVTSLNVDRLQEISEWIANEINPTAVDFEPMKSNKKAESNGLMPPDPYSFAVNFYNSSKILSDNGIRAVYSAAELNEPKLTICPVGKDAVILSPNGKISSCYLMESDWINKGLDFNIGQIVNDKIYLDTENVLKIRDLIKEKPRCKNCFCKWSCAGGCHVMETYPDCHLEYSDFCKQTRIITVLKLLDQLKQTEMIKDLQIDKNHLYEIAENKNDLLFSLN